MVDDMTLQADSVIELPKNLVIHRPGKMLQQMYHRCIIFYRLVMKGAAADL
jgi:hypothetical protein